MVRPSFRSKNWHFSKVFFLGNKGQKNVSYDILEPKNSFLGYKNKKFKRSKNWHFSKVVNNFFGPNMTIIPTCFFKQYRQGKCLLRYFTTKNLLSRLYNVFYDILERKNAFLGYKNKKFKKSKNWHFPKGLNHGFGPKWPFFQSFLFTQRKYLSLYSRKKKPF